MLPKAARRMLAWTRRVSRRDRVPHGLVLMYHRIGSLPADPWDLAVSPSNFDSQLRVLREIADLVPLVELYGRLRAGRRARPAIALTFDDGYFDNLETAKPLLEKYAVPATVFLATGHIGRQEFWWDRLTALLLGGCSWPAEGFVESEGESLDWRDPALPAAGRSGAHARRRLHDRIWDWTYEKADEEIASILQQLESQSPAPPATGSYGRPLNPEEVRELVRGELVTVGGHSVSHRRLSRLPTERKAEEIRLNRSACAALAGHAPFAFAFPNGDLDAESVDLVKAAGFSVACTSQAELVWQDADVYRTPRLSVPDVAGERFLRWLRLEWLPWGGIE